MNLMHWDVALDGPLSEAAMRRPAALSTKVPRSEVISPPRSWCEPWTLQRVGIGIVPG